MFNMHINERKAWDENFEEVYEDVIDNYKFFREREMGPGPAAGRTLYELGEDIYEYPELLFVAYATLISLISEEGQGNSEVIDYEVGLMLKTYNANEELIKTMFNELNEDNSRILLKILTNLMRTTNNNSKKNIRDAIEFF